MKRSIETILHGYKKLNSILVILLCLVPGCSRIPDYNWENYPPVDISNYPLSPNGICLNYDLDSLAAGLVPDLPGDVFLVDLYNRTPLFYWSLLSGKLDVEKIDSAEYVFWVSAYFPEAEGRNTKSFLRVAKFILKIHDTHYEFGLDRTFTPEIAPKLSVLDSLLAISPDSACYTYDGKSVADCFGFIENMEYYLYGAIVNGHTEYLTYFQKFRKKYPIVNIGEWSESLAGNERILMSIGVLEYDDRWWEILKFEFDEIVQRESCY